MSPCPTSFGRQWRPCCSIGQKRKVSLRGQGRAPWPGPQVLRKRLLKKPPAGPGPRRSEKRGAGRGGADPAALSSFWRWERNCCPITTCMSSCRQVNRAGRAGQHTSPASCRPRPSGPYLTCQASSSCVSATFWRMVRSSSRERESRSRETRLSSRDSSRALQVKGAERG